MASTDSTPQSTSRRQLLRAGGLGIVGASILVACGKDEDNSGGISGAPVSSTSVAPTVPVTQPSEIALEADATQIRTAASVELMAGDVYATYGPKLTDEAFRGHAARFAADHRAAAEVYADAMDDPSSAEPNPYLMENFVAPAKEALVDDAGILSFLHAIESMICANAINAVGVFTGADWRQQTMSFGAASARRASVLANDGQGAAPTQALYPLVDIMPTEAYLTIPQEDIDASSTTTEP